MFRHIIYAIFFWQLVNKTADFFNNIVFILEASISSKKHEGKGNNSKLEKVLLVCKRKAELLRLVEATFGSKVAFLRRIRKNNLIILKSLQEKSLPLYLLYFFFVFVELSWQLSIESVKNIVVCSLNVFMTDSVVLKIILRKATNRRPMKAFYETITTKSKCKWRLRN